MKRLLLMPSKLFHAKTHGKMPLVLGAAVVLVCVYCFLSRQLVGRRTSEGDSDFFLPDRALLVKYDGSTGSKVVLQEHPAGVPFAHYDRVDVRVIVLTYSRARSLATLLESLNRLRPDNWTGAVEIWIDRDNEGRISREVVEVAGNFSWSFGSSTVRIQPEHVGIYGQWIDSWRMGGQELALILEDDMSISPYAIKWIRSIHRKYGGRSDFAGVSLNGGDQMRAHNSGFRIRTSDQAFMYDCLGTWGFSPSPGVWSDFQDWFHDNTSRVPMREIAFDSDDIFHPRVEGALPSEWYSGFRSTGKADTMWEMWFIFYAAENGLMTVYSNVVDRSVQQFACPWILPSFLCQMFAEPVDSTLCFGYNREEAGLHREEQDPKSARCPLVERWSLEFNDLPEEPVKFDWWGKVKEG